MGYDAAAVKIIDEKFPNMMADLKHPMYNTFPEGMVTLKGYDHIEYCISITTKVMQKSYLDLLNSVRMCKYVTNSLGLPLITTGGIFTITGTEDSNRTMFTVMIIDDSSTN
eukprot:jgi/Psemu1/49761/gm1.49761_g